MPFGPKPVIFISAIVALLLLYIALVQVAGFCFPIPWGDEPLFYYPAKSFAENHTFLAHELHPHRMIYWQPPGYYIISGLIFKIFGSDYTVFRAISLFFTILASAILFFLLNKSHPSSWPAIIILGGLAMISRHWMVMGNMGRMEAIVAFGAVSAAWLVSKKYYAWALISGLLTAFVHPNGVFVCLFAALWWLADGFEFKQVSMFAGMAFIVAIALWLWFAFDIAQHWQGFLNDFKFQSVSRSYESVQVLILRPHFFVYVGLWLFNFFMAKRLKLADRNFNLLQSFALMLFGIRNIGLGLCYGIFNIMAMYISLVQSYYLVSCYLSGLNIKLPTALLNAILLATMAAAGFMIKVFNLPLRGHAQWVEMDMPAWGQKYITPKETEHISHILNSKIPRQSWVYFFPEADGLLFDHLPNRNWRHFIRVMDDSKPDYYVLHYSPFIGPSVTEEADSIYYRMAKTHMPDTLLTTAERHYWILIKNCDSCLTEGRLTVKRRLGLK